MTKKTFKSNKKHKDKSKGLTSKPKSTKSRILSLAKTAKNSVESDSKSLRINKAQQYKDLSISRNAESDYTKRGTNSSAPLLCGIFPLFDFNDTDVVLSLLKSTDKASKIHQVNNIPGFEKPNSKSFTMLSKKYRKNFTFTSCKNFRDRFDYLDTAKVVDWAIFILPNDFDELIGDYTNDLIAALIAQGLPSSVFCVLSNQGLKQKSMDKAFESITKLNLGDSRITSLTNLNEAEKLMHHLSVACKSSFISTSNSIDLSKTVNKKRGYFVAEHLSMDTANDRLTVRGCMRGFGMSLTGCPRVHLTDIGDFSLSEVTWASPEESNRFSLEMKTKKWIAAEKEEMVEENMEENDQNEEDEEGSEEEEQEEDESESEPEEESDIGSEEGEMINSDKMSFATTANTGYSLAQLEKFRSSREDTMFPDEIELDCFEKARERLSKYRALNGFKASLWPINENLPDSYKRIQTLKKYKHDRNRLCRTINQINRLDEYLFIKAGSQFEMVIDKFTEEYRTKLALLFQRNPQRHFIGSSLFDHEHLISVLHFSERRLASVDDSAVTELAKSNASNDNQLQLGEEAGAGFVPDGNIVLDRKAEPIESKETMLFQVGFRRFTATPIYSELDKDSEETGSKGKSKYLKFMQPRTNVVATVFGPITFGPVPVLQFRIRQEEVNEEDGEGPEYVAELVATGNLLTIDHTKPIIKRVQLSGQIYKVNQRSVMVRYMFFNVADIDHYKEVSLHTKEGLRGKILKASGTHGAMKCTFNKPVSQADVVLMPLYKRVFPKSVGDRLYGLMPDFESLEHSVSDAADPMDMF